MSSRHKAEVAHLELVVRHRDYQLVLFVAVVLREVEFRPAQCDVRGACRPGNVQRETLIRRQWITEQGCGSCRVGTQMLLGE